MLRATIGVRQVAKTTNQTSTNSLLSFHLKNIYFQVYVDSEVSSDGREQDTFEKQSVFQCRAAEHNEPRSQQTHVNRAEYS